MNVRNIAHCGVAFGSLDEGVAALQPFGTFSFMLVVGIVGLPMLLRALGTDWPDDLPVSDANAGRFPVAVSRVRSRPTKAIKQASRWYS
jgi:hypothetical protein